MLDRRLAYYCFMLWHAYYAQNYAGIIDAGLVLVYKVACADETM